MTNPSLKRLSLAAFGVALSVTTVGGRAASAATVTTPIQNGTPVLNGSGSTSLEFKAFNQTNFSIPLLNNQSIILRDVRLNVGGTLGGQVSLGNSNSFSQVVTSPSLTFSLVVNGLNPGTLATTNQVSTTLSTRVPPGSSQELAVPTGTGSPCLPGQLSEFQATEAGEDIYRCTTLGTRAYTINPGTASTNTNWSLIGSQSINPLASAFWSTGTTGSGNANLTLPGFVTIAPTSNLSSGLSILQSSSTQQFTLNPASTISFITYDYDILTNTEVPAPLPIAGAGLAFGFTRRLRRRIKSSSRLAV